MDGSDGCLASNTNLSAQDGTELESIVVSVVESGGARATVSYPRFAKIVGFYQEQPQLLDPVLDLMVPPLALLFLRLAEEEKEEEKEEPGGVRVLDTVARYLWLIASVRSPKTVVKFFPNDVSNLEPVVNLVTNGRSPARAWEVDYVSLLWLSLLVMVPFDLANVDSSWAQISTTFPHHSSPPPLATKLLSLCHKYLASPGATREMAALLTARLLLRPDITPKTTLYEEFVETGITILQFPKDETSNFLVLGIASAFAMLLKLGRNEGAIKRLADRVLPLSVDLLGQQTHHCSATSSAALNNVLFRKLVVKLAQRSALCYLPQKTMEDAGAVESAIEGMLVGLRDKDTIVRWSAAKGIGRIVGRLQSQEARNDVLVCILDAMDEAAVGNQDDGAWHGGCLALAELSRRSVLSPASTPPLLLDRAVGTIAAALEFDRRQGHRSVGAHVRDAAAYACWAMARGTGANFKGIILDPTRNAAATLAPSLITLACLDREVNCRRAGAAAFQEWVGRSGNIPHGIDVVTTADYYSVSLRTKAYLRIMPRVASLPDGVYFKPLVSHLMHRKIHHWDVSVRELAAKALAALVPVNPEFFARDVLSFLIPLCLFTDNISIKGTKYPTILYASVETRQGALAAIGEILFGLANYYRRSQCSPTFRDALSPSLVDSISSIVPSLRDRALMKGKGGEIVRGAACRLIEAIFSCFEKHQVQVQVQVGGSEPETACYDACYAVAFETLGHSNSEVQHKAAAALAAIWAFGIDVVKPDSAVAHQGRNRMVVDLMQSLKLGTHEATLRRGAALALGMLCLKDSRPLNDGSLLRSVFGDIMSSLIVALRVDADVGVRKEAAIALHRLALEVDAIDVIVEVIETLMHQGLGDYATDARGDVGSWVREVSIVGIHRLVVHLVAHPESDSHTDRVGSIIDRSIVLVAKQACERIERLREVASEAVKGMLRTYLATWNDVSSDGKLAAEMARVLELPLLLDMSGDDCHTDCRGRDSNNTEDDTDEEGCEGMVASGNEYMFQKGRGQEEQCPIKRAFDLDVLARCLSIDMARSPILQGLAYSIGGVDARLSGEAQAALSSAINDLIDKVLSPQLLVEAFVESWSSCQTSRMATSFISTADVLLSQTDVFAKSVPVVGNGKEDTEQNSVTTIIKLIEKAVVKCTDVVRLKVAANALCSAASLALSFGNNEGEGKRIRDESFTVLISLLGNRYPKVRVYSAEQLYTTLLTVSPDEISGVDEALALLGDTAWDGPLEVVRPVLSKLLEALEVKCPLSGRLPGDSVPGRSLSELTSGTEGGEGGGEDSNAGYGALLRHVERGM